MSMQALRWRLPQLLASSAPRRLSIVLSGSRAVGALAVKGRVSLARPDAAAYSTSSSSSSSASAPSTEFGQSWNEYKNYFHFPPASNHADFILGQQVTVHGFLQKRRDRSSRLTFVDIVVDNGPRLQLKSEWTDKDSAAHLAHQQLKAVPSWSPVAVTARVSRLGAGSPAETGSKSPPGRFPAGVDDIDLDLVSIQPLNPWPKDIIVSEGVQFPAAARHLQLRFSDTLRDRMRFREHIKSFATSHLEQESLSEVETPILFKSTPEGAREFLVPTRRPGLAYALPQSPQQYKQTLMASGFGGYFQFARCFRDEDLRADRQPEFTQLDMEMSFATGEDVMRTVEKLMKQLYRDVSSNFIQAVDSDGSWHPIKRNKQGAKRATAESATRDYPGIEDDGPFPRISYQDAMALYGSDKPDLRIPGRIERVEHVLPEQFISMISEVDGPAIDCWRCSLDGGSPREYHKFLSKILSNLPTGLSRNPDGEPVFLVHNSSKPLNGFAPLGFEAAEKLTSDMQDGDVLFMQARPDRPFEGGSTALGTLRSIIYNEAVASGYMCPDPSFKFLWVTGFPLFTPANGVDPGQGGAAGFSSTHHPFTAPLTSRDFELLATDPLRAKADHYDLVLNGCELGGGSRRIHVAHVQEFVFRSILKMTDEGVGQFRHLLEALRAGCPPHAGFALGFDRLAAMLSGTGSVRDVIAFPKTMKGEEPFAGSPSPMTEAQLETYHLRLKETGES